MSKKAFITGITGMDGSTLSELLLDKGYEVHGLIRRASTFNTERIDHLMKNKDIFNKKLFLYYGDITDPNNINDLISRIKPDEIYNLAAQSHVQVSFEIPYQTAQIDAIGTLNILEAAKNHCPSVKTYQACHSEDTLIVTNNGIKKYNEIQDCDLAYSINIENNQIELKPIIRKNEYDYDGEMINFKHKRMDIFVTPNHKMLLQPDNGKLYYAEANNVEYDKNIKSIRNSFLSLPIPEWKGQYLEEINFSDYIDITHESNNIYKGIVYKMKSEDFCYLMGLYIGDGYTKNKKTKKIRQTQKERNNTRNKVNGRFEPNDHMPLKEKTYISNFISFAIPRKDKARPKLLKILDKYNIDYSLHEIEVNFSSYTLARMFKLSGDNVYEKTIPDFILELSKDLLGKVFEGLIDSDGHKRCSGTLEKFRCSYSTASKKLVNKIVELCYKINLIPTLRIIAPHKKFFKKENRYINASENYILEIGNKITNKIYKYSIIKKKYNGKVWCVEVKDNHNFLTFRNGRFAFTGNSTSELFGGMDYNMPEIGYNENSAFHPRSPYAVAKIYGFWIVKNYREAYNMFACNGILFNHSSTRRPPTFLTRKVTYWCGQYYRNKNIDPLELGNIDSYRDEGHSKDYVRAMHLILQQEKPDDFVVATGKTIQIRKWVEKCFEYMDKKIEWQGQELDEVGICDGKIVVKINPKYFRPSEVKKLLGDPSKIKKIGWEPEYTADDLLKEMMDFDMKNSG